MLFSSAEFLLFFAVYFLIHVLTPGRYAIYFVCIASTLFYGYWYPSYVFLPQILIVIAWLGGLWVARDGAERVRKRRLAVVIVALLAMLFFFKYTDFFYTQVLGLIVPVSGPIVRLPLPLGISFITFTLIAYVVEVHRRTYQAETSMALLTAHALYFPHLLAGPIVRPNELLPQLKRPRRAIRYQPTLAGVALFTQGLIKKLVIADQIAPLVDAVYASPAGHSGWEYLLAVVGFSVQIYCDFSGYTDMALGIARVLGVTLPCNFAHPYVSGSVAEFWRRWHITLSSWLRDYIYIPLGGNRFGPLMQSRNLFATMILGGLWHGAGWTFLLWGFFQGLGISFSHWCRKIRGLRWVSLTPRPLAVLATFTFITLTWILFRAPTFSAAATVFLGMFQGSYAGAEQFFSAHVFPLSLIGFALGTHYWNDHRRVYWFVRKVSASVVWPLLLCAWMIAIAVSHGSSQKFVYFDF